MPAVTAYPWCMHAVTAYPGVSVSISEPDRLVLDVGGKVRLDGAPLLLQLLDEGVMTKPAAFRPVLQLPVGVPVGGHVLPALHELLGKDLIVLCKLCYDVALGQSMAGLPKMGSPSSLTFFNLLPVLFGQLGVRYSGTSPKGSSSPGQPTAR